MFYGVQFKIHTNYLAETNQKKLEKNFTCTGNFKLCSQISWWLNIDSPLPLRGPSKRFKKHSLRRNHGSCELVELKKMGECHVLQQRLLMKLGVSQTLKPCLNIGGWSVLRIFHLPHTILLQALLHLAFFCCGLIYIDNINRAAITSGFLSVESMGALSGKRPRKEEKWGQDFFFFSWLLPFLRLTFPPVEVHHSSQVSLWFWQTYIHTEKHRHQQDKNKKFPMSPLHSISPSWLQEVIVLFFGIMN